MKNLLLFSNRNKAALRYDFMGGGLSSSLAFERVTNGGRVNAHSNYEVMPPNAPRFDYAPISSKARGLLIEAQTTNLALHSDNYMENSWIKARSTIAGSSITAPDGQGTMQEVTSTGSFGGIRQAVTLNQGETYTLSAYVKQKNHPYCYFVSTADSGKFCSFDLTNGSIQAGTGGRIEAIDNGVYRVSFTITATNTNEYYQLNIGAYTGDDYSGYSLYAWGAQIEQASEASSFIPTEGSVVTRASDQLAINIPEGVTKLRYSFEDGGAQDLSVSAGPFIVPTNLDKPHIQAIEGL